MSHSEGHFERLTWTHMNRFCQIMKTYIYFCKYMYKTLTKSILHYMSPLNTEHLLGEIALPLE